ncbi:MAG TPA: Asp-tRNA(Asn)/Glu-tRNA(Gln) amidotransferase subunit GatC [Oligoflexia bacterium]|nr:Asp-tRNA(Asn)/Glu-tRNA(Gln) amidotransferase subunit GatC [Oligoflexia bacterium]HMP49718.1 Asp-tRNA(Asn)/Glu-tRNA(Gln) amidotransferase subunit GatC [Oligoflexia bacterium]
MSFTEKDILHVAELSSIAVEESEIPGLAEKLGSILTYVDRLSEIPTRGVLPTYHVHGISNVFRDDVLQASFNKEDLKLNAPDFSGDFFRVPQVIKHDK